MSEIFYTNCDLWLRTVGEIAVAGFSDNDDAWVEKSEKIDWPRKGDVVHAGQKAGILRFNGTNYRFSFPVSGIIVEVNNKQNFFPNAPLKKNRNWFFKIRMTNINDLSPLLTRKQHSSLTALKPRFDKKSLK